MTLRGSAFLADELRRFLSLNSCDHDMHWEPCEVCTARDLLKQITPEQDPSPSQLAHVTVVNPKGEPIFKKLVPVGTMFVWTTSLHGPMDVGGVSIEWT